MDEKKKARIDAIWLNTDFGRWAMCAAEGKTAEAQDLKEKIFNSGYFGGLSQMEAEIAKKILPELGSLPEWDDYLKALEPEHPALVEFMIAQDLFGDVLNALYKG